MGDGLQKVMAKLVEMRAKEQEGVKGSARSAWVIDIMPYLALGRLGMKKGRETKGEAEHEEGEYVELARPPNKIRVLKKIQREL